MQKRYVVEDCYDCPLSETRRKITQSQGSTSPRILIVGQSPTEKEDIKGTAFVGAGGKLLKKTLSKIGLDIGEVLVTNAVRCHVPNKQPPASDSIKACRPYIFEEILYYQPDLVIGLGDTALNSLLRKKGVFVNRGIFHDLEFEMDEDHIKGKWSGKVLTSLHPNAILKSPENYYIFESDLKKAKRWFEGVYDNPKDTEVDIIQIDEIEELKDYLLGFDKFAFDIETTGLDYLTDDVLCLSFSAEEGKAKVVPIRGQYNVPYLSDNEEEQAERFAYILDVLKEPLTTRGVIGQKVGFDCSFFDFDLSVYFDTMLASMVLHPSQKFHNLEQLRTLYTDLQKYDDELQEQVKIKGGKDYSLAENETLWKYAGGDTDTTLRVANIIEAELEEENLLEPFLDYMMPIAKGIWQVEKNGVFIDVDYLKEMSQYYIDKRREIESKIYTVARPVDYTNINDLKQLLYVDLKLPILVRTKIKKEPAVNKGALKALEGLHPVIELIKEVRQVNTLLQNFLVGGKKSTGLLGFIRSDGRIHPDLMKLAETLRLRCTGPNLNQIPKEEKVRGVISEEAGRKLIEADFSQGELWIAGYCSGDKAFLAACERDVHRASAAVILNKPEEEITDLERGHGKNFNFGLLYGITAWGIHIRYGVEVEEAERWIYNFEQAYPDLAAYQKECMDKAFYYGYVDMPLGFRREFGDLSEHVRDKDLKKTFYGIMREARNWPFQCTLGILNSYSVPVLMSKKEYKEYDMMTVLTIHDSIISGFPEELEKEVIEFKKNTIESVPRVLLGWEMKVDVKVSKHLGVKESSIFDDDEEEDEEERKSYKKII